MMLSEHRWREKEVSRVSKWNQKIQNREKALPKTLTKNSNTSVEVGMAIASCLPDLEAPNCSALVAQGLAVSRSGHTRSGGSSVTLLLLQLRWRCVIGRRTLRPPKTHWRRAFQTFRQSPVADQLNSACSRGLISAIVGAVWSRAFLGTLALLHPVRPGHKITNILRSLHRIWCHVTRVFWSRSGSVLTVF
jgi:hypothetical protein